MKKSNQNKKTKNSDVGGLNYNLVFRVSFPMNQDTIDTDTEAVASHVIKALEIVSSEVKGIKLEQSQHYGSEPVNIPILESPSNG
jgi:hypothetical protein